MRDLLQDPLWQGDSLGCPLPESPHAVSVSLPLWDHVIGYEEGDPAVVGKMMAGYPRFFLPPLTQALFKQAESAFAREGEGCLVFPSKVAAERCAEFVEKRQPEHAIRVEEMIPSGLWVVVFPESIRATVRLYWRFSGEIVSSRWAKSAMENVSADVAAGLVAKQQIRARLARLAGVGAGDVFLFPSGMAAVFAVHRMLETVLPGRRSVQLDFPYVDVLKVQEQFGQGVDFHPIVTPKVLEEVREQAAGNRLNGVFCEIPSNPMLSCVPVAELGPDLRKHGVPLVIDDTVASVININALKYADVVTTSLSKAFSGVGDVLAGAVTLSPASPFYGAFREFLDSELATNDIVWWEDAVALERNSRDFPKRARRASLNATLLAKFLEGHRNVERVYYPNVSEPGFSDLARPNGLGGCLLTFTLKDPSAVAAVYDALKVCKGPSLGTNFTIACPYTMLAHYTELDWAAECGVPPHLLRVSVGLEEMDDLYERFETALAKADR